ncbi:hypothetical protein AMATHDRAFT_7033 [Amanita thiersii Skay4041]|uniref:Ankyrin repeat protein n=1 Tax=Amanita thiersii Skay4041 TaxID=703135 RepID=A0A2A9N9C1_9AGAR|nr:hypothetical protein AMATHDRAFT_7033 [Amanita thiersii Skay4041]
MVQSLGAQAFLSRIEALPGGPGVSLDEALKPSLEDEVELRRLFAADRSNQRLSDPYVGLVDVFAAPASIRTTRARVVKDNQEGDLNAKYVMPLTSENRRKEGEPCMVADLAEFKKNWGVLTEGSLSQLVDWNNVVAAGGSVLACLTVLAEGDKVSKKAMRKFYHATAYPTSDLDLFLWGLTPLQAEKKIIMIYEAVRDSVPWDVTCIRTKHTITLYSQYPYRSIQIVLRLYKSPAEILAGFDIDAPCCAYDGERVWANPRAIIAMMRQCNTIDVTRRSPSYEVRLSKYAKRGFEVYVPTLIFERSIVKIGGLARLLVLERLGSIDERQTYLKNRNVLRGRPLSSQRPQKMKERHPNDLKAMKDMEKLEVNDYDVGSLHIPYGPSWDARRIDRLIYQTQPSIQRIKTVGCIVILLSLEQCKNNCPEPIDDAERELQVKEDQVYIRGRISFIEENPGRQRMTGSFNPIDVGEWSAQVYIGHTERFFTANATHDRARVSQMIKEGTDVNRRDHIGRSPLQFAIICKAAEIACDLVDAGARMIARLVDGRTSLHLAVQFNQGMIVRKLLERSALNKERSCARGEPGDEDEDETCAPDIFDINTPDWDFGLPPLAYAVLFASLDVLEDLIAAGADVKSLIQHPGPDHGAATRSSRRRHCCRAAKHCQTRPFKLSHVYPLTLTALRLDEGEACKIAESLILAGASSSAVDNKYCTVFVRIVASRKVQLVLTVLRCDPNANAVVNFPVFQGIEVMFPLMMAIHERQYSMVVALLAYGARVVPLEDDITKAVAIRPSKETKNVSGYRNTDFLAQTIMPLETALVMNDDIIHLLVSLGADVNRRTMHTMPGYTREEHRRSLLDWIDFGVQWITEEIDRINAECVALELVDFSEVTSWKNFALLAIQVARQRTRCSDQLDRRKDELKSTKIIKEYLEDVRRTFISAGAKTWAEILDKPGLPEGGPIQPVKPVNVRYIPPKQGDFVTLVSSSAVPTHVVPLYHELFEACFNGDDDKIQTICLPPEGSIYSSSPLQIAVQFRNPDDLSLTGLTPFTVAVERRNWKTARLILAISVAQYKRQEDNVEFSLAVTGLDNVGDNSNESKVTVDSVNEKFFVDIAKCPSAVQCNAKPEDFFFSSSYSLHKITNKAPDTVMSKAIKQDDLEIFVKLLDMGTRISLPVPFGYRILNDLIAYDRHEMLDAFIRNTGQGLDPNVVKSEGKVRVPIHDENKLYLGLNVHGKKQIDLARKNYSNFLFEPPIFPLLWKALGQGAVKIVDYLAGDRPCAAYRSYSMSHNNELAEMLRGINNLKERLPLWLGWSINSLGESPLTATVLHGKVDAIKVLFVKRKQLMMEALHKRYKVGNLDLLQLAVRAYGAVEVDLLDFLLEKGFSPLETDDQGNGIYHILCMRRKIDLLGHLLKKLPSDVNEMLVQKQTKERQQTPLHIAVESGSVNAVQLLLAFSPIANTIRDGDGSLPLHVAVRKVFPKITSLLINSLPSTIFMEDGMGSTASESIQIKDRIKQISALNQLPQPQSLHFNGVASGPPRFQLSHLEKEIPALTQTIDLLLKEGRLKTNTELEKELLRFADKMEGHMRRLQQEPAQMSALEEKQDEHPVDSADMETTLKVVKAAVEKGGSKRELVHLNDVRQSVECSLRKSLKSQPKAIPVDDASKGDKEVKVMASSFVKARAQV